MYCEVCDLVICRDCAVVEHIQAHHTCIFVSDAGMFHERERNKEREIKREK